MAQGVGVAMGDYPTYQREIDRTQSTMQRTMNAGPARRGIKHCPAIKCRGPHSHVCDARWTKTIS
eukprot:4300056-Pleurochrysis_carterae.AAC.1